MTVYFFRKWLDVFVHSCNSDFLVKMYRLYHIALNSSLTSYYQSRHIGSFLVLSTRNLGCKHSFKDMIWTIKTQMKSTMNLKRKKDEKSEFALDQISNTTQILYYALKLNQTFALDMKETFRITEQTNRPGKSCVFQNSWKTVKREMVENTTDTEIFLKLKRDFQENLTQLTNKELSMLLFHITNQENQQNGKANEVWPYQRKKFFNLLERELFQRLHSCFQYDHNKESFREFENILHILLQQKVGFRFFLTYIQYCIYCSKNAVTLDNLPLLLLSMCRVRFESQYAFTFLEDFMSKHLDDLEFPIVSLFCLTFFICNMPITSEVLLDQIGTRLLQSLREQHASGIQVHDIINILKSLRHSGYFKASFYEDLECLLLESSYMNNCNLTQMMQILRTFVTFKIYPSKLIEKLTQEVKVLLRDNSRKFRMKDLCSFVRMLGLYQYKDNSDDDIFSVCIEVILRQLRTGRGREPPHYTAMYLSDCATGLLYAGKFNEDILDALFGMTNIVDYLEETSMTELLVLYNTIKLEFPKYRGRRVPQAEIDRIQSKVNKNWNINKEMDLSSDLKDQVAVLQSVIEHDKMEIGYILPYLRTADITLFLDSDDRLVKPEFAKKKVAIEVIGWGQCIRGTNKMLGSYSLKLRHLEKLGYKIITVGPQERNFVRQYGSQTEKKEFWVKKLQDSGIKIS